jgi:hypothetical protein
MACQTIGGASAEMTPGYVAHPWRRRLNLGSPARANCDNSGGL